MIANRYQFLQASRRLSAIGCFIGACVLPVLLLPAGAAGQAPTVSNIQFEAGSHSSVSISFAVSAAINDSRIRYIPTAQGSCTSGSGGQVQNNSLGSGTNNLSYIRLDVTGLAPNTQYEFCPEVSSDGGNTWSSGVGATWTTLPLPAIHPTLPIHPATFDTSYPDETQGICWSTGQPGYCKVTETVSGNSCPNLNADISSAVAHQTTGGTEIDIPAGSVCVGKVYWDQVPPDVLAFDQSKVANNAIYLPSHGLSEGQGVIFDTNWATQYHAAMIGGVNTGYVYFVHVVDANDFELYSDWQQKSSILTNGSTTITVSNTQGYSSSGPLRVGMEVVGTGIPAGTTITAISGNTLTLSQAATATGPETITFGGNLVPITPGGNPNGNSAYYESFVLWPRPLYWVIVRTSTPDTQFAPVGTRVSPAWASKMAVLQMPAQSTYQSNSQDSLLSLLDGYDSNGNFFTSHIRFSGIEFTWTPYSGPASNPVGHGLLVDSAFPSTSDIVFDRDWFHNPGNRQDRVIQAFWLQGRNLAIIDSYWDNMDYWHASYSGGNVSTSAAPTELGTTSFSVPPTTVYYGAENPATLASTLTVSWSGTTTVSNPEIAVYFDMNNALQIVAPEGLAVNASSGTVSYTTIGGNGWCSQGDAVLPTDANGREAAAPLACAVLNASGQISSLSPGSVNTEITEGCQCVDAGVGPGPYEVVNNYISGTGLVIHFDDAGGGRSRGDYLIQRNTYHTPFQHMSTLKNPYAQAAGIPSDGYEYSHRQPLEWKGGQRVWIDGNIFDGAYKDINAGNFVDLTPRTDGSTTDVDVTNNTFQHGPVGFSPTTVIDGCCGNYLSWPADRWRLYNNLFWDINGWVYATGITGLGTGSIMPGSGGPAEDFILDHNTLYDFQGYQPEWMNWAGYPLEGFQMTNNILTYSGSSGSSQGGFFTPYWSNSVNCGNMFDEAFMNCAFTANNTPDYIFKDNVIIPSWNSGSYPPSGQFSQATIAGYFPDYATQNYILPGASGVPATYASIGFFNTNFAVGNFSSQPDFRLRSTSIYQSGGANHASDGKANGADIDALEAAEGKVTLIGVPASSITSTSATVSFFAPDAQGCPIDYSSTDPSLITAFTRVTDSGGARVRNIALTGLTGKTTYFYRVNCAVQQPTGSFRTN